jgi:two-component system NtrC family response regulator
MALARANGNIVKASELLGVTRPTLYDLMRRLSIQWKDADASVTASTD